MTNRSNTTLLSNGKPTASPEVLYERGRLPDGLLVSILVAKNSGTNYFAAALVEYARQNGVLEISPVPQLVGTTKKMLAAVPCRNDKTNFSKSAVVSAT